MATDKHLETSRPEEMRSDEGSSENSALVVRYTKIAVLSQTFWLASSGSTCGSRGDLRPELVMGCGSHWPKSTHAELSIGLTY